MTHPYLLSYYTNPKPLKFEEFVYTLAKNNKLKVIKYAEVLGNGEYIQFILEGNKTDLDKVRPTILRKANNE